MNRTMASSPQFDADASSTMPTTTPFRVGTLRYTRAGLITLCAWLLWGDFCLTLMETIVPQVLPLKLGSLGGANKLIGLLVTTIPSVMNIILNPIVSFRSDRYRSRWGRRRPFLLFATPFLAAFLILMGFSDSLGSYLHAHVLKAMTSLSPATTILILIGIFVVGFQFFNMFINTVYWYIFNDVVPSEVMGRFIAVSRTVTIAATSFFQFFLLSRAETHTGHIFIGAGILYFTAFMLMCWKVKEGEYPPPPETFGGKTGLVVSIKTYAVECFSSRYYWFFFLFSAMGGVTNSLNAFNIFVVKSVGITLGQFGIVSGATSIAMLVLMYPAGILVDRWHPVRATLWAVALTTLFTPLNLLFLLNMTPMTALGISIGINVLRLLPSVIYTAAYFPMIMAVLPKDRFGQFSSANSVISCIFTIAGVSLGSLCMDWLKSFYHDDPYYYRYLGFWTGTFQLLTFVFLYFLYRMWKKNRDNEKSSSIHSETLR